MRLLSARIRDYRLHHDCSVSFDPRFTVIAGPNQSGKSTLAEALHRALFLSAKTGGDLLKEMHSNPYRAEPEVELSFEAAGDRWQLCKRFGGGTRGSVSLRDSGGRSLQGDAAEERLAELIGTTAVPRNRSAADQLKERWAHLWVWQGSASTDPLEHSTAGYDHDRLVERLQEGADLGVQSPLDLAVVDAIEQRWAEVYTAGGAKREPQVRKGSPLQQARSASLDAQASLTATEVLIAEQQEAEREHQGASERLEQAQRQLPVLLQQQTALTGQLNRSRELEQQIANARPLLEAAGKERQDLSHDLQLLLQQQQRQSALEAARAPEGERLETLQMRLPELENTCHQAQAQLQMLRQGSAQASAAAAAIEARQNRLRLLIEQTRLEGLLQEQERLAARAAELDQELARLPAVAAADVERLRRLQAGLQTATARAEALATGVELLRAGQPVRLDGELLAAGTTRLLTQQALLQVGDGVELRLLPGGGGSASQAAAAVEQASETLRRELARWQRASVEDVATAERRRSDLEAERARLSEQGAGRETRPLRQRLSGLKEQLAALAADPADGPLAADALPDRLAALELELQRRRQERDAALQAERQQQRLIDASAAELEGQKQAISALDTQMRERENQLLEARTRVHDLLARHGSREVLAGSLAAAEERLAGQQRQLEELVHDLAQLQPATLTLQAQQLAQRIEALQREEREAREARIRAESRLHADGRVDLQAELEQRQAELESRWRDQERLEKEAGMLSLLRRLLEEEQNAMASTYTEPLTRRISLYLGEVFPQAPRPSLSYDARTGFEELQWRRGDEAAFRFGVLSTGAREQFAAALRVAMAEVLAEGYDGCLPVIFDDAFANSDPERQAGVHRMLWKAAERGLQVILLSCDAERCQGIAGARQIRLGT